MKRPLLVLFSFLCASMAHGQYYTASKTVNAGQNMTVDIAAYPIGDSVRITLSGPSNVWFGFGFGGSAMTNTYAIITEGNGNISERKLGNHTSGTALTSSFTTSNRTVASGIATTTITRSLSGLNANYFTFPSSATTISMIWAYGSGSTLNTHANRGATTLSFSKECAGAVDVSVMQTGAVLTANLSNASYQWLDCNNGFAKLNGETSQVFTASTNGNYAVEITSSGCVDTSACFNVTGLGTIEAVLLSDVKLFPNPSSGSVRLAFGSVVEDLDVEVHNLNGKVLSRHHYQGESEVDIDLPSSNGLYLINIKANDQTLFKRVVKY